MTDKEVEKAFLYGSGVVYQGHIYTVIEENDIKHEYALCRLPSNERVTDVKASELIAENDYKWEVKDDEKQD